MRSRAAIATAAFLAALSAACGARTSTAPAAGGRIVIGVRADPKTFNVYTATNAFAQEVADLLQLRLMKEGSDFADHPPTFQPQLARAWEFSPDHTTLTVHLDPAARWSDGVPVSSADVVFSFRASKDADVGWVGRDVKEFITQVEAPDPTTVLFRFSRVYPYQLMDAAEGNVVPAHVLGAIPFAQWPKTAFVDAPISSGPFRLARYERGASIELARNPSYVRAPLPRLDSVVFRILPEESTLLAELVSGGIDVMENVPAAEVPRLSAEKRLRVVRVPDLSYTFVCWNAARPMFADARVRRALTMAIDRDAIVDGLLEGSGRVSAGPIPSMLWAHDPDLHPLPYDVDRARELLASAGWTDKKPLRFELETSQESGLRTKVAEMIAAQLRKVGVEAVVRPLEFGAFVDKHERHEFDAFVGSWRESTKVDLKSTFHSAGIAGGYNYGGYASPQLDRLIDQARGETDPAAARRAWNQVQATIAQDQPYTFLFERDRFHAVPKNLEGFRPTPTSIYAGLEEWSWSPRGVP